MSASHEALWTGSLIGRSAAVEGLVINGRSDTERSQEWFGFPRVAHVFHTAWHGIRSAAACLPGLKIGIPHNRHLDAAEMSLLLEVLHESSVSHLVIHGVSGPMLNLATRIRVEFGKSLLLYAVSHVSPAQFVDVKEMAMMGELERGVKEGVFRRIGSVKPGVGAALPSMWPEVLINTIPRWVATLDIRESGSVFVPVENTWRKNLYTNVLASLASHRTRKVYVVNWPGGIEKIADTSRIRLLPFLRPLQMLNQLSRVEALVHVSLAECQPMTILEGLAAGTVTVTTRLTVHPELSTHPLAQLTEVDSPDNLAQVLSALTAVQRGWEDRPQELKEMVADYAAVRDRLSQASYESFLDESVA